MHHHYSGRDVEQQHRGNPEHDVGGAQLARGSEPECSGDEENLRENQIAQAQFLFEFGAVASNLALGGSQVHRVVSGRAL
jgi:hypothetical protein